VSITVIGIVQLIRGKAAASLSENIFEGSSTSPSAYALALYSGLWAFDGWDQTNYVGGEMKNPEKNIPRAIHLSMVMVIVSPRRPRSVPKWLSVPADPILTSKSVVFRGIRQGLCSPLLPSFGLPAYFSAGYSKDK
jgi:hypothetical protein